MYIKKIKSIRLFLITAFTAILCSCAFACMTSCSPQPDERATQAPINDERLTASVSDNSLKPERHVCYLTFDDGPSVNTPRILEILKSQDVLATWFVKADSLHMEYLPDIWNAGHQVAVHTFSHEYENIYSSTEAFWADIDLAHGIISDTLGFDAPKLLRFPGGSVNSYNAGIVDALLPSVAEHGYHYYDWNVSSGDSSNFNADEIVAYARDQIVGNNSSCILMHDSGAKNATVEALPGIITVLKECGYEFDILKADSFGYHF